MVSLQALLLTVAVTSADPTLLDFYSPHCGPCRTMAPTVERLAQAGYPVQKVNVDQQPQLAQRYGVRAVPSFVLVSQGRVVDRVEGPTSFERLRQMFAQVGGNRQTASTAPADVRFRGQSPDPRHGSSRAPAGPPRRTDHSPVEDLPLGSNLPPAVRSASEATVRLRVEDPQGHSWGTGTIIDVHGDEALVVTCGHLFRDSGGKGKILVELFAPGAKQPVPGELIAYDADKRDIGLVSIRPGIPIRPAPVAPAGFRSFRGDRVFSIGCNHGQDPTVRNSHVTAINKYLGPANVEVAGQPVDGRSGGGLFSANGALIGICNAADPQDDEGIYAALDTIHWQLREVGQERIFLASSDTVSPGTVSPGTVSQAGSSNVPLTSLEPLSGGRGSASADSALVPVAAAQDDVEVICIVRRRDRPNDQAIVLDDLPPELLAQLVDASRKQPARPTDREPTVVPTSREASRDAGPIVRGQSQDNHPAYQRR